jgi:hypothetical protein
MLDSFYQGELWRNCREKIIFDRLHKGKTVCEYCGQPIYDTIIGHHIKELTPYNVNDYSISLNPDNIMLVHSGCHNLIHKKLGVNKEVYIVYGSPYSGKTSWVRERVTKKDIVCDLDSLYTALNPLCSKYIKSEIYQNVVQLQLVILDNIKTRYGMWGTAYVITTKVEEVERLRKQLNANDVVFMECTEQECLNRLKSENLPAFIEKKEKKLIKDWYMLYGNQNRR